MNSEEAKDYRYEDIKVGQIVEFERFVSADMVDSFSELSGDYTPLHTDEEYSNKTRFKGRICHGMLLASFFSAAYGMHCPGKRNLCLTQQLNYKAPLKLNRKVKVKCEVVKKVDSIKVLFVKGLISDENGEVLIEGEARLKVRDDDTCDA